MSNRLKLRIERLERPHQIVGTSRKRKSGKPVLVVLNCIWKKPNLENATYRRVPWAELVELDGNQDDLADGEFEAWLAEQRRRYHVAHPNERWT